MPTLSRGVLALAALVLSACASSAALQAARRGDDAALAREIAARHAQGTLGNGEAADIAKQVASREVTRAKGPAAVQRVREARACATQLKGALELRAQTHDDAGGEAALALVAARE